MAIMLMVQYLCVPREPNLEPLREVLDEACELADRRGHQVLGRGDLLIALLRQSDKLPDLCGRADPHGVRAACETIESSLPPDTPDERERTWQALEAAIDLVAGHRDATVDRHCLLAALCQNWPLVADHALQTAGFDLRRLAGDAKPSE